MICKLATCPFPAPAGTVQPLQILTSAQARIQEFLAERNVVLQLNTVYDAAPILSMVTADTRLKFSAVLNICGQALLQNQLVIPSVFNIAAEGVCSKQGLGRGMLNLWEQTLRDYGFAFSFAQNITNVTFWDDRGYLRIDNTACVAARGVSRVKFLNQPNIM